jgi:DNA-binding NtrC family response regulator
MRLGLGSELTIGRAIVELRADEEALANASEEGLTDYGGIVGDSPPMHRLFAMLRRLEGSLVPVLVLGESGVGKELVARALHRFSSRSNGPFVALNCGALARELVASELFGHKKGAFTNAHEARRGAFEAADGGTLFLDEIGELPLDVQPVLLRALELGEVRPVGADAAKRVDVRVVTATHRDLVADVDAQRFRRDLYYRLAVVRLRVPALRERPGDVERLAQSFAEELKVALPPRVIADLKRRAWPGNVRELRNAVHAFAALGELQDLPPEPAGDLDTSLAAAVSLERPYAEQKEAIVERFNRAYLDALLAHTGGNQSAAARIAGLDRTYLGRLLQKHDKGR